MAGILYVQMLFTNYFFKYCTDVLLIAPAAIGTLLFATRLWDAVLDPVVGYASDARGSSSGRRRPWLLLAAAPMALSTWLLWNPPAQLGPQAILVWTVVVLVAWETAMTAVFVPYMALGSEISMVYHERTFVSGSRHIAGGLGYLAAILSVQLFASSTDSRQTALWMISSAAPAAALLVVLGALRSRERPEHRERGPTQIGPALRHALRNVHLRSLCLIYFLEIPGTAMLGLLGAHFSQYVMGDQTLFPKMMLGYVVMSYLVTPLAIALGRRLGKAPLWGTALGVQGVAFAMLLAAGPGDAALVLVCAAVIGAGAGTGHVVGPSVLADVTDYDEYTSGERKEGTYYAAINITRKLGFASMSFVVGLVLQTVGFEPNVEQSESTRRAIQVLFATGPPLAFLVAIWKLRGFGLDAQEHARIRAAMDGHGSSVEDRGRG